MEYADALPHCKRLDFGTRFMTHLCAYCAYIAMLQLFLLLDSGKVLTSQNKSHSLMHIPTYIMNSVTSQFMYKNWGFKNHYTGLCSYSLIHWWTSVTLRYHADKPLDINFIIIIIIIFFWGGGGLYFLHSCQYGKKSYF